MDEKKTILDYAKTATNEAEKPVKHVSLKYDEENKRVYAEVTIKDEKGIRLYYVYNEKGINYYLDCLVAEEHKTIGELLNEGSLKISIDEELLNEKGVTVNSFDGKKGKVTYNWDAGKVVFPAVTTVQKTSSKTKSDTVTKSNTKSSTKTKTKTNNSTTTTSTKEDEEDEAKRKKRIRNLRIFAGLTALALLSGYIGSKLSGGKNDVGKGIDNGDTKSPIEHQTDASVVEQTDEEAIESLIGEDVGYDEHEVYVGPNGEIIDPSDEQEVTTNSVDEVVAGYDHPAEFTEPASALPEKPYYALGSDVPYDDMDTQIQLINDECFRYAPTSLYNLVYEDDRDAIFTIISMRNGIFEGRCNPDAYMDCIINYVFESGTTFDGKGIKSFDSLSPYGQYIVLVSAQSVLQLNPNYACSTPINNYNYDTLCSSFDYMIDSSYRTLTNNSKTY